MQTTRTTNRHTVRATVVAGDSELDRVRLSGTRMPSCTTRRHTGAVPESER